MHKLKYVRSDGAALSLLPSYGIYIATVVGATGHSIDISLSQGYQQIGETASEITVAGQAIDIRGYVLDGRTSVKTKILSTFTPLTRGTLIWEDKYFIDVIVKEAPTVTQTRHSKFSLSLYAPYPFWKKSNKNYYQLGGVTAEFSFPVNYATTHRFGTRTGDTYFNCYNAGDMPIDYEISMSGTVDIVNPSVTDIYRHSAVSFTGTVAVGEVLKMYRENGVLRVTLTTSGIESDAFDMLDDTSDLFQLQPGDNVLRAAADSGEPTMTTLVAFYAAYAGVLANGV